MLSGQTLKYAGVLNKSQNDKRVTMDEEKELDIQGLLDRRQQLTDALLGLPYDLILYIERAVVYSDLGYPDLAAGDGYRALLLSDEVRDESFEYHEHALSALLSYSLSDPPAVLRKQGTNHVDLSGEVENMSIRGNENGIGETEESEHRTPLQLAHLASIRCYEILSISLLLCGCLKSAYEFCERGLAVAPGEEELLQAKEYIQTIAKRRLRVDEVDIDDLPDQGLVRREIYPWNDHEPDRCSEGALELLNTELAVISPKCLVKVTELPTLVETGSETDGSGSIPMNRQLGIFAKDDILPGETVLDEYTVLTANIRLKESFCDACSTTLPPLDANSAVVGCPECDDTMFCNAECLSKAQESYHPAICDKDIDTIAKDPDPREAPNALYLLLLARALAMSANQECHPLELKEVKYIWGDFLPSASNAVPLSPYHGRPPPVWTLPFSFASNISGPLHVLEKMDIDVFACLAQYDLWVFNTLYSKFRGTASARASLRDGRPEVAAVHPLWCLANHDCDPNVQWEWGGHMKLWCRDKRIDGSPGGIKSGEEVLNHYCDIHLTVQERREWAAGSLGGYCMCSRCLRETAEEEAANYESGTYEENNVNGLD